MSATIPAPASLEEAACELARARQLSIAESQELVDTWRRSEARALAELERWMSADRAGREAHVGPRLAGCYYCRLVAWERPDLTRVAPTLAEAIATALRAFDDREQARELAVHGLTGGVS